MGIPVASNIAQLKNEPPHIVVGTPGRTLGLVRDKHLNLKNVRHFIVDECDRVLESLDMRRDVQEIFRATPHEKQVMMFSATLSEEMSAVCEKFMHEPMKILINSAKLTLHGLQQHFVKLAEEEKNRKLNNLLDALQFNQVVIFVNKVARAKALNKLLVEFSFPPSASTRLSARRSGSQGTRPLSALSTASSSAPTSFAVVSTSSASTSSSTMTSPPKQSPTSTASAVPAASAPVASQSPLSLPTKTKPSSPRSALTLRSTSLSFPTPSTPLLT